ncbi:CAP-Gly domain-containing linker protein 1 isoform X1 [Anopheles gambiae]|uniref:CAP-Gly domain-containing linker protein 1 isoform X1 n=1 Tax=Anopheles gambiae TaxID=7165 RepID=UPI002AC8A2BD|nr:CAP-Gly domain-containing linker protein 1 isoform X1 [Anopheles gambiae]
METVGEVKEAHPEGDGGRSAPHFPSDVPGKLVPVEGKPAGSLPDGETASADPQDDTSLNARLLDKLNEQFEKQIQLVESERLDDGFKLSVYAEWVNSLRTLNTELVQSLREMQDTCMERMQLMRAAYLKDFARFGPEVRLRRLQPVPDTLPTAPGEQIVSLELSSNYPIIPASDEMLVRELNAKTSLIDELRTELKDLRKEAAENGAILEQLRNMALERDKQLDDKRKEIGILQQQIVSLNDQLLKVKMSTMASTDNRSLISEITDHHDKITQLRKKLKEQEDKLRQANTAIQFRDEVIAQQRQEIKLLNEVSKPDSAQPAAIDAAPSVSYYSVRSSEGDLTQNGMASNSFYPSSSSTRLLFDELGTIQQGSETESACVQVLKREIAELRDELHKRGHEKDTTGLHEMEKALLRLRGACEELLQSTGKLSGWGDGWREGCDESGAAGGCSLRFEDDDELIEAMRDRCEALCRQLGLSHKVHCTIEQDEGIGSASTSRLEHSEPAAGHRIEEQHQQQQQQQLMHCIERQLKRLLGGKEHCHNSGSESLSSLSLGLDEGCTLQGLIDDLKKEIESKDLVLRGRHDEMEQLRQELSSQARLLNQCQARQEQFEDERTKLLQKIASLEESVDDQNRTIAMLNMEKLKLVRQVDDLKETLHQYRDNLQKTSEEKVVIEDECKNQLVTISNLRVALEETKRNGSSSVSVLQEVVENLQLEVILLSEQLNDAFKENLSKDNELDHYRDANLQLRCQLAELSRELADLKDISDAVDIRQELHEQKQRLFALLKDDVRQLQDQMNGVRGEIESRQQDLGHLSYFREKCAEMERLHELELSQQRSKHSSELKQLRREIESLSNQLAGSADTGRQHEQMVESLATLQTTITKLDEHNRLLQKTIQSYQENRVQLEQQLGGSQQQLDVVRHELDELKGRSDEQERRIESLRTEKDRLAGELLMQRKMCKCGHSTATGSGSRERAKVPLSHSLQKQLAQKTLEVTRVQEELLQRTEEWKRRETEYVSHRVRATEQATGLIEQLSELKGRFGNVEQAAQMKDELIDRLQQSLRDVTRKFTTRQAQLTELEAKNVNLSDALDKARQEALLCEKRCTEEQSNARRCSMDQKNQLQQYERQINRLRAEVDALREKCDQISSERDVLRDECQSLRERLAKYEGKESALCEVVKSNQDELAMKASRVLELEETNRKLGQNYQQLKELHDSVTKQYQLAQLELEQLRDCSKKLAEFKQQTLSTKELTRKSVTEWKEREAQYCQEIGRLKKRTELLEQDRSKLIGKLNAYHRDNTILARRMQQSQQQQQPQPQQQPPSRQHSPYDDNRRSYNLTPLHQTFYPPDAYKLVRSTSDPNCNESDELLQKVEYTCSQLQQIRRFWHQGLKEVFPPEP